MNLTYSKILYVGLSAWLGLASLASCVSSDDAPAGGRVEHPDPGAKAPPNPTSLAPPAAPTQATSEPSAHPSSSSDVKSPSGFTLSPLDKAIAENKPARPWSTNVPKRRCTKDDECGDGFCDRGRCAAIWTWSARHGQRCDRNEYCGARPCIDGRCRSCISDKECEWVDDLQDPICVSDPWVPGSHECSGVVSGFGFEPRGPITPQRKSEQ